MSNIERTKYTNEILQQYRNVFMRIVNTIDDVMNTDAYFTDCCRKNEINYFMLRILMQTQTFQKLDLTGQMMESIPTLPFDIFIENPYVHFYKDVLSISDEDIVKVQLPLDLVDGIEYVLSNLNEKEQFILRNRYGLNETEEAKTLDEIGKLLNITRERVRQIETKAIHTCRTTNNLPYFQLGKKLADVEIERKKTLLHNEIVAKQNITKEVLAEDTPIEYLEISVRSYNALKKANINTLKELLALNITDLYEFRNLGKTSVNELMQIINTYK